MISWLLKRLSEAGPSVTVAGSALRRHPDAELRRLLSARVLIERRRADTWPVCTHCDCGHDARPIREVGGRLRACCPHDAAEDEVLEPDDLRRFGIDEDRLAGVLAASAGLSGSATRIGDGIRFLGVASMGRGLVLCRDPDLLAAPGAILAIKAAAGTAPVTVIATAIETAIGLRLQEAGIEARSLADCLVTDGAGKERLALDRLAPLVEAPRLVVSRCAQAATLDGRRLDLPTQMFVLFQMLAEQARQRDPVLKKETIEANTGRPANEIVRDLRRSLVDRGLTRETVVALVATVRGYGYCLGLNPSEVAVED
jgi:hypothetical protein